MIMLSLGAAIRTGRKLRKLTQEELAKIAGLSRSAVVALEAEQGRVESLMRVLSHCPVRFEGLPPAPTLGAQIAARRHAVGMSVAEAARQAVLAENTVRSIERGGGNVAAFLRLAQILAPDLQVLPVPPRKTGIWRSVAGQRNLHRDPNDYYATPIPITQVLLENVDFDREAPVLEPCLGEARAIETALKASGFRSVIGFDIQAAGRERKDFFEIEESYDYIITNPPFKHHVAWIQHAKRRANRKIALLLPLTYLTGSGRLDQVWSDTVFPLCEVLVINRGFDFLADPHAPRLRKSQMYMAWYIWSRDHQGPPAIRWIDIQHLLGRPG
ncbi:MAG: helix-turn-helix domain-containing protein [Proteobacteria bacterium]|nr:MAG: helix-turn-helix domain-containing protein [Pseudomonadota bacterium]